jgi:hypothetical protein
LWESPKERDHSEDRGVDEKMGSEWILGRLDEGRGFLNWTQLAQDRGPAAGSCKYDDEPSGSGATDLVS